MKLDLQSSCVNGMNTENFTFASGHVSVWAELSRALHLCQESEQGDVAVLRRQFITLIQKSTSGPHPQPDECTPYLRLLFLEYTFYYFSIHA
jgi:hypothetical protein